MKLHIGKEIRRVLEEKGITAKWLAQKINTSDRNLYDLLTRDEIGTGQLKEISKILNYDFFSLYQKALHKEDKNFPASLSAEPEAEYTKRHTVSVMVELDGLETTLESWVTTLKKLNAAM